MFKTYIPEIQVEREGFPISLFDPGQIFIRDGTSHYNIEIIIIVVILEIGV